MATPNGYLVAISARSQADLLAQGRTALQGFQATGADDPAFVTGQEICSTEHTYRLAGYYRSRVELASALDRATNQRPITFSPRIVWLYPGSGVQYPGMGKALYGASEEFRRAVDQCATVLQEIGGFDPRILYQADRNDSAMAEFVLPPSRSGIAVFVYQYAMTKLLQAMGTAPDVVVGHSLGEYAAAVASNSIALADALKIMHQRGTLLERLDEPGAMLVLHASAAIANRLLTSDLTISSYNGRNSVGIAGSRTAIEELQARLTELGIAFHRVRYGAASHCSIVEPLLDEFSAMMTQVKLCAPTTTWHSTTPTPHATDPTSVEYWRHQFRMPVHFSKAVDDIAAQGPCVFLEIGPQTGLSSLIRTDQPEHRTICAGQHAKDEQGEVIAFLRMVCELWNAGDHVNIIDACRTLHHDYEKSAKQPCHENSALIMPPISVVEEVTRQVWHRHLNDGSSEVDFFSAGGHSLLAVRMASELSTLFHLTVPASTVLANPTVPALSQALISLGNRQNIDVAAIAAIWKEITEVDHVH